MNDIVQRQKDYLSSVIRGCDKSARLKNLSFYKIIQEIDTNSDLSEKEIIDKFMSTYNRVSALWLNSHKNSQLNWLRSNKKKLLGSILFYASLNKSIMNVDSKFLDWYKGTHSEDNLDNLYYLRNNDLGTFIFSYNNALYSVAIFEKSDTMGRYVNICNLWIPSDSKIKTTCITYDLSFELSPESGENYELNVTCNNIKCPRWKQSVLSTTFEDNARDTFCSLDDCKKCTHFDKNNTLRPSDALSIAKGIYECMLTRGNSSSDNESKKYEHIPLPMRQDDVIIYFGEPAKSKSYEEIGLIPIRKDDNDFVSSHASPREHHRRGGYRRAYTRKDGTKVKATTFKETTVNKGYVKTNYKFKERSGSPDCDK